MNDLEKARHLINEADKEIIEAFKKRMIAVKEVIKYKKEHNLSILDKGREDEVKKNNLLRLDDLTLAPYYIEVLDTLLKVSKEYQQELLDE